ncbi:hypothetical protein M8J75_006603 [Diaphorina citri]|nr:hypothetical protein M8J75_006603 [Diaphorina citri]
MCFGPNPILKPCASKDSPSVCKNVFFPSRQLECASVTLESFCTNSKSSSRESATLISSPHSSPENQTNNEETDARGAPLGNSLPASGWSRRSEEAASRYALEGKAATNAERREGVEPPAGKSVNTACTNPITSNSPVNKTGAPSPIDLSNFPVLGNSKNSSPSTKRQATALPSTGDSDPTRTVTVGKTDILDYNSSCTQFDTSVLNFNSRHDSTNRCKGTPSTRNTDVLNTKERVSGGHETVNHSGANLPRNALHTHVDRVDVAKANVPTSETKGNLPKDTHPHTGSILPITAPHSPVDKVDATEANDPPTKRIFPNDAPHTTEDKEDPIKANDPTSETKGNLPIDLTHPHSSVDKQDPTKANDPNNSQTKADSETKLEKFTENNNRPCKNPTNSSQPTKIQGPEGRHQNENEQCASEGIDEKEQFASEGINENERSASEGIDENGQCANNDSENVCTRTKRNGTSNDLTGQSATALLDQVGSSSNEGVTACEKRTRSYDPKVETACKMDTICKIGTACKIDTACKVDTICEGSCEQTEKHSTTVSSNSVQSAVIGDKRSDNMTDSLDGDTSDENVGDKTALMIGSGDDVICDKKSNLCEADGSISSKERAKCEGNRSVSSKESANVCEANRSISGNPISNSNVGASNDSHDLLIAHGRMATTLTTAPGANTAQTNNYETSRNWHPNNITHTPRGLNKITSPEERKITLINRDVNSPLCEAEKLLSDSLERCGKPVIVPSDVNKKSMVNNNHKSSGFQKNSHSFLRPFRSRKENGNIRTCKSLIFDRMESEDLLQQGQRDISGSFSKITTGKRKRSVSTSCENENKKYISLRNDSDDHLDIPNGGLGHGKKAISLSTVTLTKLKNNNHKIYRKIDHILTKSWRSLLNIQNGRADLHDPTRSKPFYKNPYGTRSVINVNNNVIYRQPTYSKSWTEISSCLKAESQRKVTETHEVHRQSAAPALEISGSACSVNEPRECSGPLRESSGLRLGKLRTFSSSSSSSELQSPSIEPLKPTNRLRVPSTSDNLGPNRMCSRCSSLLSMASSSKYSVSSVHGFVPVAAPRVEVTPSGVVLCKVCLLEVPDKESWTLSDCHCSYCLECVLQYVEFEIGQGAYQISCPDAACERQGLITLTEIQTLVSAESFEKHKRFRLNKEVDLDKSRAWCPAPGCDTICTVRPGDRTLPQRVVCVTCSLQFCSLCREKWHAGACNRSPAGGATFDSELIKCCPMCSVPIEKDEGCAQMLCKRCKHVFCWYCLASLDDDFLLRHYDKGPCKNKLGHSRASVIWHRTQVIGIFAGFGILLLVASPLLLLAAPCIVCCKCHVCTSGDSEDDLPLEIDVDLPSPPPLPAPSEPSATADENNSSPTATGDVQPPGESLPAATDNVGDSSPLSHQSRGPSTPE